MRSNMKSFKGPSGAGRSEVPMNSGSQNLPEPNFATPSFLDNLSVQLNAAVMFSITSAVVYPVRKFLIEAMEGEGSKLTKELTKIIKRYPHIKTLILVIGGVAVLYKIVPGPVNEVIQWRTAHNSSSVLISKTETLYGPVVHLIAQQNAAQEGRHVSAKTAIDLKNSRTDWSNNTTDADGSSIIYDMDRGHCQRFTHEGESYWLTNESEDSIRVWHMSKSISQIDQMLTNIYRAAEERKYARQVQKFDASISGGFAEWKESRRGIPHRTLDSICLEPGLKKTLNIDLEKYFHKDAPAWYANRGRPYRRGYLLHGPPGTGKTSLIRAICGQHGLRLYEIKLSLPGLDDEILAQLFDKLGPGDMVLLEDIDAAGAATASRKSPQASGKGKYIQQGHEPENSDNSSDDETSSDDEIQKGVSWNDGWDQDPQPSTSWGEDNNKTVTSKSRKKRGKSKNKERRTRKPQGVTLAGLLNAIDGTSSPEGHLLIMTSNHPEKLDSALTRPGRIDRFLKLDFACYDQLRDLFKSNYVPLGADIALAYDLASIPLFAEVFAKHVPEGEFTPAEINEYLYEHDSCPEAALKGLVEWVKDTRGGELTITEPPSVEVILRGMIPTATSLIGLTERPHDETSKAECDKTLETKCDETLEVNSDEIQSASLPGAPNHTKGSFFLPASILIFLLLCPMFVPS